MLDSVVWAVPSTNAEKEDPIEINAESATSLKE
ncbi:MAG: hypothetical protein ACI9YU_000565 [Flavobacteriales bacterium]